MHRNKQEEIRRWNLFARELEDILIQHGLRLSQLDDRANIHREKVRRLRRSLEVPKSFPILNPDEMSMVIEACFLTENEVLHLRAAIIATAIEAMLMDRLNQDDALKAAEQILPVIEVALQEHANETSGMGVFKRGGTIMTDDTNIDSALEPALGAIDRATIALHLSRNVASATECLERVRQARDNFAFALTELEKADIVIKTTEAWREWSDEAKAGYQVTTNRIADLGGQELGEDFYRVDSQ